MAASQPAMPAARKPRRWVLRAHIPGDASLKWSIGSVISMASSCWQVEGVFPGKPITRRPGFVLKVDHLAQNQGDRKCESRDRH